MTPVLDLSVVAAVSELLREDGDSMLELSLLEDEERLGTAIELVREAEAGGVVGSGCNFGVFAATTSTSTVTTGEGAGAGGGGATEVCEGGAEILEI
jgi:hypothetical protein